PLNVVEQREKCRLILDLRKVNEHLCIPKFKYEGLARVAELIQPNDWMLSVDLKSGYHHVDIHPTCWKYLGFQFEGNYYLFQSLLFGLATAPFIFTQLIKQLAQRWRSLGWQVIPYVDDILILAETAQQAGAACAQIVRDLRDAGIVINEKKLRLVPTQELRFLGLELNTQVGKFSVGEERRSLNAPSWHSKVSLSTEAIHELHFWVEQFDRFNGAPFHHPHHYDAIIQVDASAHSCGATLSTFHGTPSNASTGMPDNLWPTSSTRCELEGVLWALRTFMDRLRHGHTLVRVDNQGVMFILRKGGSCNNELTLTCKEIITLCTDNAVRLAIEWIPRDQNTCADELSKLQDHDDYTLKQPWFRLLDRRWGPHSVDLFANAQNTLLPRFFSKVPHPRAEAINAFSKDWHGERGFAFLPPPPRPCNSPSHASHTGKANPGDP
ncbi:unnamed protein product, partial [Closterium sp. NIES-53]